MADPIGISASLLTIADAAVRVGEFIQQIRHCPAEVLALNNEINDLRFVLSRVEAARDEAEIEGLEQLLERSRSAVARVESIFSRLRRTEQRELSMAEKIRFIVTQKEKIQQCIRQLREIRSQLDTLLAASTARTVSDIFHAIGQLQLTSFLETNQPLSRTQALSDAEGAAEQDLTPSSDESTAERRALAIVEPGDGRLEEISGAASTTSVETHIPRACRSWCSCRCHRPSWYMSPKVLEIVLGKLFVGYDGNPLRNLPCNNSRCARSSVSASARATYFFPSWFVHRAVDAAVHRGPFGDVSTVITIRGLQALTSPVFSAVATGDIQALQSIFASGAARPSDIDHEGNTLIFVAVAYHRPEVVRFLIKAGSDPYYPNQSRVSAYDRAWAGIIMAEALHDPSRDAMRDIFNDTRDLDSWQLTRIHRIVLGLLPYDLQQELELSAAEVNTPDSHGRTPLWWAAAARSTEAVETLLDHGADPDISDCEGAPPLRKAMAVDRLDMFVQLLSAGADPNWKTSHGMQVTHSAASSNMDVEWIEVSLNPGLDLDARGGFNGNTPLLMAVRANDAPMVEWLLEHGADPDKRDTSKNGYTPLMQAVVLGNRHACVKALLRAGADVTLRSYGKQPESVWELAVAGAGAATLDELAAAGIGRYFDQALSDLDKGSAWGGYHQGFRPGERESLLRMLYTSECKRCILDAQAGVSPGVSLGLYEIPAPEVPATAEGHDEFHDAEEHPHYERQRVPHTHRKVPEGLFDGPMQVTRIVDDYGRVFVSTWFRPDVWILQQPGMDLVGYNRHMLRQLDGQLAKHHANASRGAAQAA